MYTEEGAVTDDTFCVYRKKAQAPLLRARTRPHTDATRTRHPRRRRRWRPRQRQRREGRGGVTASRESAQFEPATATASSGMNCEVFSLPPLRCEAFQVKAVLRAVLHTILFSRTLGVVRPRDVDCDLFDLTYATCGDSGAGSRQSHLGTCNSFLPPPPHACPPHLPPLPPPLAWHQRRVL